MEEMDMKDDQTARTCPRYSCEWATALEAARSLGFEDELKAGTYTCCQVTQWYQEQWQAWYEAGMERIPWYMADSKNELASNGELVYLRKRTDRKRPSSL